MTRTEKHNSYVMIALKDRVKLLLVAAGNFQVLISRGGFYFFYRKANKYTK